MSPELQDLMFAAIDHAIGSIAQAGGPMTPFVIATEDGSGTLHRFVATTVEEGEERARAFIRQAGPETTQVALALDGYVTVDAVRTDAVLVEVQSNGAPTCDVFAQCYEWRDGELCEIGNVKHIAIAQPPLFGAAPAAPRSYADGLASSSPPAPTHKGGLAPEPTAPNAKRSPFARLRGR